jgi:hypothetical protein
MMHMRMMWWCVALVGIALILGAAGIVSAAALFAIPCLLMMGAMMWMMMRGMGRGSRHN